ncbi:MAG: phytanoyl-CoA dioxygenase family protein [bacterium]|nr:phytanoyl-CoA dioxygenase family protein [bacterium]
MRHGKRLRATDRGLFDRERHAPASLLPRVAGQPPRARPRISVRFRRAIDVPGKARRRRVFAGYSEKAQRSQGRRGPAKRDTYSRTGPKSAAPRTTTFWLALDDSTPENGCMRFAPGSHTEEHLRPHRPLHGDREKSHTLLTELNEGDEIRVTPIGRGDVTVHNERVLDGVGE